MKLSFFGITWAQADWLWWIVPVTLIVSMFLLWHAYKKYVVAHLLADRQWHTQLLHSFSLAKVYAKTAFLIAAVVCCMLALARPQWNLKEQNVAQEGRNIIVALDISGSMLAQDCLPNRLACAQQKIKKLLSLLSHDRVGLLLFAGEAIVQCPLTVDHDAFCMFLEQVDANTISSGTTALEKALTKIISLCDTAHAVEHTIVVIFTDGEDFSRNLAQVKQQAQEKGITVVTVGVGTPQGAPVPLLQQGTMQGYQKDEKGAVVISRRNDGILENLAYSLGGAYIPLRTDSDADMHELVSYVHKMEKEKFEDRNLQELQDQYGYFVALALLFFALEWIL